MLKLRLFSFEGESPETGSDSVLAKTVPLELVADLIETPASVPEERADHLFAEAAHELIDDYSHHQLLYQQYSPSRSLVERQHLLGKVFEVRVLQGVFGRDPLGWIGLQHFLHLEGSTSRMSMPSLSRRGTTFESDSPS